MMCDGAVFSSLRPTCEKHRLDLIDRVKGISMLLSCLIL